MKSPAAVWFINGPNANLYGLTSVGVYGNETFADLQSRCERRALEEHLELVFRQSNHEGVIIDWIQEAMSRSQALIINAAGLTYTSISILDALLAYGQGGRPVIEVHMSNIHRREPFRDHSYMSKGATGIIAGFGSEGYELAITAARRLIDRNALAAG